MDKIPTIVEKYNNKLLDLSMEGRISNRELVQIIEHISSMVNLQPIQSYANMKGKSYNGIKNHGSTVNINGAKLAYNP